MLFKCVYSYVRVSSERGTAKLNLSVFSPSTYILCTVFIELINECQTITSVACVLSKK